MIALAVNIALMGFILQQGIQARLAGLLPGTDPEHLRAVAARLAAGDTSGDAALPARPCVAPSITAFGLVMLYGGLGVWILAALSLAVFGWRQVASGGQHALDRAGASH